MSLFFARFSHLRGQHLIPLLNCHRIQLFLLAFVVLQRMPLYSESISPSFISSQNILRLYRFETQQNIHRNHSELQHQSNTKAKAMFSLLLTTALALLITTALALPTVDNSPVSTLNVSQLVSIAPKSSSCANAPFPSECRTAAQAVGPISASFITYGVTTPGEQAAILSTMAFESDDFQYQINHFPGTPGQGTRNMQSPAYNLKYAQSIPALAPYLKEVQTSDVVAVIDLLIKYTNYDFGSAAVSTLSESFLPSFIPFLRV